MNARAWRHVIPASVFLLGTLIACAHDDAQPSGKAGEEAAGEAALDETAEPDPLEEALRPSPSADEDEAEAIAPKRSVHPGKLERIERQRRASRYETATKGGEAGDAAEEAGGAGKDGIVRLESESYGTPGLVLVRAMEGAQSIGYTVLSINERDRYFIALKKASFFQSFVGSQRGACKIAVGTEKNTDDTFTRVILKARAQVAGAGNLCEKDLERIRAYARGEVSDKHKKKRNRIRPAWKAVDEE